MTKKKIGIVANKLHMDSGLIPSLYRAYVNNDYVESLEKAGAVPVLLPVIANLDDVPTQLQGLDGIVLSGGYDIDPSLYGEEPTNSGFTMIEVDKYYIEVVRQAERLGLPMLGICKGLQAINVAHGGTLYQDQKAERKDVLKHTQQAPRYDATHAICTEENSFMREVFGQTTRVNSYHHQSIKKLGENLRVTATAPDGIVEAVESTSGSFICGVQFHPEMMAIFNNPAMLQLFKSFLQHCK